MRRRLPLSLLLLTFLPTSLPAQRDLSRDRNKNRVLLVFAPSRSDPRWRRQDALLAGSAAAFRDRDLRRYDLFAGSDARASTVRARYRIKPTQFRVLLIGKDGHVAYGGPSPVSLGELTGRIDRMPMRREETRRRGLR